MIIKGIKTTIPYVCIVLLSVAFISCDYILGPPEGGCTYISFSTGSVLCLETDEDYCLSDDANLNDPKWYEDNSCSEAKEKRANGGGSGGECGTYSDSFNPADVQVIAQCQAAYAYKCAGNQQGVNATCAIIRGYGASNISKCPYCS